MITDVLSNVKVQDAGGEILSDFYLEIPESATRWENRCMLLAEMISKELRNTSPENCIGICFATTGPMDTEQGVSFESINFDDAIYMPIRKYLQGLNLPVEIANITAAGTILEHLKGNARGLDSFLKIANAMMGMGAYLFGEYLPEKQFNFGEIGAMECVDGRKDKFALQTPIGARREKLYHQINNSEKKNLSFEDIFIPAIRAGDEETRKVLQIHCELFAPLLNYIVQILNPQNIILPSWCAEMPKETIEYFRAYIAKHNAVRS